MSRTQATVSDLGIQDFSVSFNMRDGQFSKQLPGNDDFIPVEVPFNFILLDTNTFRIGGNNKTEDISSTIGHRGYSPRITVTAYPKNGNGVPREIGTDTWRNLKPLVSNAGGRYAAIFYVATPDGEIVKMTLRGQAYTAWIDFIKKDCKSIGEVAIRDEAARFAEHYFSITGLKKIHNAEVSNDSWVPVFAIGKISKPETGKMADELCEKVTAYLKTTAGTTNEPVKGEDEDMPDDKTVMVGDGTEIPDGPYTDEPANEAPADGSENPADDLPF